MANRSIQIVIKSVYGETKVYPACPISESFARIAGTKTLTPQAMREIFNMGFDVVDVTPRASIQSIAA